MKSTLYGLFLVIALGMNSLFAANKSTLKSKLKAIETKKIDANDDYSGTINAIAKKLAEFSLISLEELKAEYTQSKGENDKKKAEEDATQAHQAKRDELIQVKNEYIKAVKEQLNVTENKKKTSSAFYKSITQETELPQSFSADTVPMSLLAKELKKPVTDGYNKALKDNGFLEDNDTTTLKTPELEKNGVDTTKQAILEAEARVAIIAEITGIRRKEISKNSDFAYTKDQANHNMATELAMLNYILATETILGKLSTNFKKIPEYTQNFYKERPKVAIGAGVIGVVGLATITALALRRYNVLRTAKYKWFGMELSEDKVHLYANGLANGNTSEEELLKSFSQKNVDLIKQRAEQIEQEQE